jgi:hypothetical protein
MRHITTLIMLTLLFKLSAFENREELLTRNAYLDQWRGTAIQQQKEFHIPASITMAQAILESGSGNSELARKANNHFGIKCHNWKGETILIDDDQKSECFRVYRTAEESFKDHSMFLKTKSRYAFLFQIPISDYKSWAKGLKDAGYATNPQYADLLIDLIEDLKLNELDLPAITEMKPQSIVNYSILFTPHHISMHTNNVNYIVARKGDTYVRIANEFGIGLWQLYKYNDRVKKQDFLLEGEIIYLQPKRRRSEVHDEITISSPCTLIEISQKEAVSVRSLRKLNKNITSEFQILTSGSKVTLH